MSLHYAFLSSVRYHDAVAMMERQIPAAVATRQAYFWGLEHPLVYTSGLRTEKEHILDDSLQVIPARRGGSVTLHNPGQLVFYTVCPLILIPGGLEEFVRRMEVCIIKVLEDYGVACGIHPPHSGVFTPTGKIAFAGVGLKGTAIYHGVAINLSNDLRDYEAIFSCGLKTRVSSVQQILGKTVSMPEFSEKLYSEVCKRFEIRSAYDFRVEWEAYCDQHPDLAKGLITGIRFFNERKYWEAHEVWEIYWRRLSAGTEKTFLQGLIQAASSMFKLSSKPNSAGSRSLAQKALLRLQNESIQQLASNLIANFQDLIAWLQPYAADQEDNVLPRIKPFIIESNYEHQLLRDLK